MQSPLSSNVRAISKSPIRPVLRSKTQNQIKNNYGMNATDNHVTENRGEPGTQNITGCFLLGHVTRFGHPLTTSGSSIGHINNSGSQFLQL
ncbi:hypothetical protein RRG08_038616 [Elysia crispata]|uniref:Uncharacterized protein n=1 Tax=Elysia crispata TaxID=231223 RepID=A0AAE0YL49_9GAST|nr:hypothetical protein RRG08_038616 [Elysia crispata]